MYCPVFVPSSHWWGTVSHLCGVWALILWWGTMEAIQTMVWTSKRQRVSFQCAVLIIDIDVIQTTLVRSKCRMMIVYVNNSKFMWGLGLKEAPFPKKSSQLLSSLIPNNKTSLRGEEGKWQTTAKHAYAAWLRKIQHIRDPTECSKVTESKESATRCHSSICLLSGQPLMKLQ